MENLEFKQKLAEYLLQIKAIHFNLQNPYTWASGWKSPNVLWGGGGGGGC